MSKVYNSYRAARSQYSIDEIPLPESGEGNHGTSTCSLLTIVLFDHALKLVFSVVVSLCGQPMFTWVGGQLLLICYELFLKINYVIKTNWYCNDLLLLHGLDFVHCHRDLHK